MHRVHIILTNAHNERIVSAVCYSHTNVYKETNSSERKQHENQKKASKGRVIIKCEIQQPTWWMQLLDYNLMMEFALITATDRE